MKRRVLVLAVAALAVLAGCSGGVLDGGWLGQEGASDAPPVAEQAWASESGVHFERLFERHRAIVSNASSFEHTIHVSGSEDFEIVESFAVNRPQNRFFLDMSGTSQGTEHVQETFVVNDSLYSKSGTAADPRYSEERNGMNEFRFQRFVGGQSRLFATPTMLARWDFEYVGYGDGAYRFEADSAVPGETGRRFNFDTENATATNATLVVDERGYIRRLSISTKRQQDGETVSSRVTATFSGLDETTVLEPSWVEKMD